MKLSTNLVAVLSVLYYADAEEKFALPRNVIPKKYELYITTDLTENVYTFDGRVLIKILVKQETNEIIVHCGKNVTVTSEKIYLKNVSNGKKSDDVAIKNVEVDKTNEIIKIFSTTRLEAGQLFIVYFQFNGSLSGINFFGEDGYFRAPYYDILSSKVRFFSRTNFLSKGAKDTFPCFNEHDMKATFSINLGHEERYKSVSNMPLSKSVPMKERSGWIWNKFEISFAMSPYQIGFAVLPLTPVIQKFKNNRIIRIWTVNEATYLIENLKTLAKKLFVFYENFFGMKYPIEKLDIICVTCFDEELTHPWGILFMREFSIYVKRSTGLDKREAVAKSIAFSMAHQWFCNSVTYKTINDTRFQYGVVNFVSKYAVQKIFPEWDTLNNDMINCMTYVNEIDSRDVDAGDETSHENFVAFRNDFFSKKEALLVRMLFNTFGEKIFMRVVRQYLKKFKHGSASKYDFYKIMTEEAVKAKALPKDVSIEKIMDCWSNHGYPVITVIRDYERNCAKVNQRYFNYFKLQDKSNPELDEREKQKWLVPLTYTNSKSLIFNETTPKKWLTDKKSSLIIKNIASKKDWVIFNINYTGIMKVKYDEKNWKKICTTLNSKQYTNINSLSRANILVDALDFAYNGDLDYKLALKILGYLSAENNYIPWRATFSRLTRLFSLILRTSLAPSFKNFIKNMIRNTYERHTDMLKPEPSYEREQLKQTINMWACKVEMKDCIQSAVNIFKKWLSAPSHQKDIMIPESFRFLVLCMGVKYGTEEDWNQLWELFNSNECIFSSPAIMMALTCTEDAHLIKKYLGFLIPYRMNDKVFSLESSMTTLSAIVTNRNGYKVALNYMLTSYGNYTEKGDFYSTLLLGNLGIMLLNVVITEEEFNEVVRGLKVNVLYLKFYRHTFEMAQDTARRNLSWKKNQYRAIKKYLDSYL